MGDKQVFQPLTREEKIMVVLYRVGIVASAVIMSALAYLPVAASSGPSGVRDSHLAEILVYGLYAAIGMSVLFIHLYVVKLKFYLKNLYFLSLVCLAVVFFIGKGSLFDGLAYIPYGPLLLLPLSGCLGFVTAKEAFCFQLFEGYLLAMIMPLYLVLLSAGMLAERSALSGIVLIAFMLVVFTLRKVFQPLAYDIGDKSAYH